MKKILVTFLLCFIQSFLIITCDSAEVSKKDFHPWDHMATISALVAHVSLLPEESGIFYYKSISFFASKLITQDAHCISMRKKFPTKDPDISEYVMPDMPSEKPEEPTKSLPEETFFMFSSMRATKESIRSIKDAALKKSASTKPTCLFQTDRTQHQYNLDSIIVSDESGRNARVTIHALHDESESNMIVTHPHNRPSFFYSIGKNMSVDAPESKMKLKAPLFPGHDILIQAEKAADNDGKNQIIKIWAFPQEA